MPDILHAHVLVMVHAYRACKLVGVCSGCAWIDNSDGTSCVGYVSSGILSHVCDHNGRIWLCDVGCPVG